MAEQHKRSVAVSTAISALGKHMKFPLHVEPDQPSHGEQLCIVDANGIIIARSPSATAYRALDQVPDQYNLAWLVDAANTAHNEGVS